MHTQMTTNQLTRKIATVLTAVLIASGSYAQTGLIKSADKKYAAFSYKEAARLYELAVGKGASEVEVASRAADSYWRLRDMRNAERWYAKAAALPDPASEDVYRYSETLRSNGKIAEADQVLQRYKALAALDSRADRQYDATNYVKELNEQNLFGAEVKNLDINSERSDMGVGFLGEQVTFASSRLDKAAQERNHTWNGAPFLDLYVAEAGPKGDLMNVRPLDGPFNTKYHESNLSASASGQDVLFTRNNYDGHKRRKDENGITGLKMYSASRTGTGPWGSENAFIHNNDRYSVGHPALTPDGKRLYFTSNRPGGKGGTDIWYCEKAGIGGWGQAANAEGINTEGNEMFPFIGADGLLFFASDGHKGLGGLDVMMATVSDSVFSDVRNPGAPINSTSDDFGLVLRNGTQGYFTSNRPGGKGDDDIYSVTLTKKPRMELKLDGAVRDERSNEPLSQVVVRLKGADGTLLGMDTTDANGYYQFKLQPGVPYMLETNYNDRTPATAMIEALPEADSLIVRNLELMEQKGITLIVQTLDANTGKPVSGAVVQLVEEPGAKMLLDGVSDQNGFARIILPEKKIGDDLNLRVRLAHDGYLTQKTTYSGSVKELGEIRLNKLLELSMQPMEVGSDLGKLINLEPIYFDVDKSVIRGDAAKELDKVVTVMNDHPEMIIELGSHTDCRASAEYNRSLSDRRAKSSSAYIVKKGISSSRISGKGFGESELVNDCACEGSVKSTCTDEQHQMNRRTEFIIKKM